MCGIFCYIGNREVLNLLVTALKRLEYRGYDSAGVGVHGTPIQVCKAVGKVRGLEEKSNGESTLKGTLGIAHTRWATHGKPSVENSHPHTTEDRSIAVVHNGVIENYVALKQRLSEKGYVFTSQTDTELLAHLVRETKNEMPNSEWHEVVAVAMSLCEGAYGVGFIFAEDPDLLIGARKGSPLIVGVGQGEYMLASDPSAVVEHTKDVVYLRDGEMVELRRSGYKTMDIQRVHRKAFSRQAGGISSPNGVLSDNPINRIELSLEQIEKGGYEHFMLKEIIDQPNAFRNALRGRLHRDETGNYAIKLGGLESDRPPSLSDNPLDAVTRGSPLERLAKASRIIIAACGTSWHSGQIAKYTFENLAGVPVEVEYASEFRYRKPILYPEDVIIAISQSGETADTLEAIKIAKQNKAMTFGIVNVVGSSIARETDAGVYLHAGPEIGVASTKAFTGQVIAILLVSLKIALHKGTLSQDSVNEYCAELERIPDILEEWLPSVDKLVRVIARYSRLASNAIFCGCGVQFPVALEGALKLKEISYIHAEGFSAAEIMHGAVTLIRNRVPVVVIAMMSDPAYKQVKNQIARLKSSDTFLIVVTDEGNTDFDENASFVIPCPATTFEFEPLLTVVPMQLMSYHIANMRGCEIDQPRNLAKAVTVE